MTDAQQIAERLADTAFRMTHPGMSKQMSGIVADCKADIADALLDAGLREAVEALWKAEGATARATFLDGAGEDLDEANLAIRSALAALKGEKA